jgi:hypothetical protein
MGGGDAFLEQAKRRRRVTVLPLLPNAGGDRPRRANASQRESCLDFVDTPMRSSQLRLVRHR